MTAAPGSQMHGGISRRTMSGGHGGNVSRWDGPWNCWLSLPK